MVFGYRLTETSSSDGGHRAWRCSESGLEGAEPEGAGTALVVLRAVPAPSQIPHVAFWPPWASGPSTGTTSLGSHLPTQVWAMLHLGLVQPTLRSAQLPGFSNTSLETCVIPSPAPSLARSRCSGNVS